MVVASGGGGDGGVVVRRVILTYVVRCNCVCARARMCECMHVRVYVI